MAGPKKTRIVSLRLTEEQYRYLYDIINRIKKNTGLKVPRSSIMVKLMEYGLPHMEKDFPGPTTREAVLVDHPRTRATDVEA